MSDQLSSLLEAVEKNRNFAALSTYSISQLTKAAKNKVIENLEASTVVISVLEAHSDNLKMLEIVSECIKQLASDARHAGKKAWCSSPSPNQSPRL
jgi:hypothetical protein